MYRRKMMGPQKAFQRKIGLSLIFLFAFILMFGVIPIVRVAAQEGVQAETTEMSPEKADVTKFGLIAAAIAFGFGAIGAGIAIANVGAAAMGAIAEKPEIAGQALIFIALAEGLVVFGFITALMILGKV
jgi:V/A-type H+-transporting ATPase subunit K